VSVAENTVSVAREVDGDPVQPGRERTVPAKAGDAPISPHKGILDDFFGIVPVAEQRVSDGEQPFAIPFNDLGEGGFVTVSDARHERCIQHSFLFAQGTALLTAG
jgi:hypothetical protein